MDGDDFFWIGRFYGLKCVVGVDWMFKGFGIDYGCDVGDLYYVE